MGNLPEKTANPPARAKIVWDSEFITKVRREAMAHRSLDEAAINLGVSRDQLRRVGRYGIHFDDARKVENRNRFNGPPARKGDPEAVRQAKKEVAAECAAIRAEAPTTPPYRGPIDV